MDAPVWKLYALNLICIGVDQEEHGEYAGRIWHPYHDDPLFFHGTVQLLCMMEQLYDEWEFPQSSTSSHSFITKCREPGFAKGQFREGGWPRMNIQRVQDKKGDLGTFLVRVKYRQNSSWQGEVVWAEGNQKECFRSALELIKMMDGALEHRDPGSRKAPVSID